MLRIVITVLLLNAISQAATIFDLSTDFSLQHNPSGVWQYGYSASNSLDPKEFRFSEYADPAAPIGFWHPDLSKGPGPGWYPYIAYNSARQTMFGSGNGWAARAGEVAMEASSTGQYSLVRFVAPIRGTYQVSAQFEGIHFGLSSTDVHVLSNGTQVFGADIAGYGGDPAFHKVEGSSPTAAYSGKLKLRRGDMVTFAVGFGKNKTNFCDTTGLVVHIVQLSDDR